MRPVVFRVEGIDRAVRRLRRQLQQDLFARRRRFDEDRHQRREHRFLQRHVVIAIEHLHVAERLDNRRHVALHPGSSAEEEMDAYRPAIVGLAQDPRPCAVAGRVVVAVRRLDVERHGRAIFVELFAGDDLRPAPIDVRGRRRKPIAAHDLNERREAAIVFVHAIFVVSRDDQRLAVSAHALAAAQQHQRAELPLALGVAQQPMILSPERKLIFDVLDELNGFLAVGVDAHHVPIRKVLQAKVRADGVDRAEIEPGIDERAIAIGLTRVRHAPVAVFENVAVRARRARREDDVAARRPEPGICADVRRAAEI